MKYFWAQVNASRTAHCRYFQVPENKTLEEIVAKHFYNFQIVDFEEVTKEYAEKNVRRGILS